MSDAQDFQLLSSYLHHDQRKTIYSMCSRHFLSFTGVVASHFLWNSPAASFLVPRVMVSFSSF